VFLTSGVVTRAQAYWAPYTAAKSALEALVKVWAVEMASTPVRANLFNPGPLRTALRASGWPGEDPDTLQPPETAAAPIADMLAPGYVQNGAHFNLPTGETRSLIG